MNSSPPAQKKSSLLFFVVVLAFVSGAVAERFGRMVRDPSPGPAEIRKTFAPFLEAWSLVQDNYVDKKAVQPQRMTRGAIRGMLNSLGDYGHTTYLTPQDLKDLKTIMEGHFEGIGARMTMKKKQPTILQTMPGSPARKAGLKAGDVLLEVNGKPVAGFSLERIVQLVKGPANTKVHLRVRRTGQTEPLDFDITRGRVEIPDVTWAFLPGAPIAHLAIHEFGGKADRQLQKALEEVHRRGGKGLIVDVRGNPGGLKEQAVAVTSQFLSKGTVFVEKDAAGEETMVAVRPGGLARDIPLCVLIDEGTASSAEIFAGAVQDHQRGTLIGTKTFGTGTVLQPFKLSDGSAVLLAVAEWFTPKGRQIWHQGIAPDYDVTLPEGTSILLPDEESNLDAAALAKTQDQQFLKGLEILKKNLK